MKKSTLKKMTAVVIVMLSLNVGGVFADEALEPEIQEVCLTYEEAAAKAIDQSVVIRNQLKELEKLETFREEAGMELRYFGGSDTALFTLLRRIHSLDASIQVLKKEIEVTRERVAYDVRAAMNIISLLEQEELLENMRLQNAGKSMEEAKARYAAGTLSLHELNLSRVAYDEIVSTLSLLEISIENAWATFTMLTRITVDQCQNFEFNHDYQPLVEDLSSRLIQRFINNHPSLWNQEMKIQMAELELTLYTYQTNADSYSIRLIDLSIEKSNLVELKARLEETVRSQYYQVQKTEAAIDELHRRLESLDSNIIRLTDFHQSGIATSAQVEAVRFQKTELEKVLLNKIIDHQQQIERLYKPYV